MKTIQILLLSGLIQMAYGQSTLDLFANFNTIGVNVYLNELDTERDAIGLVEYRQDGQNDWHTGFALSRVDNKFNALSGSIFWCTPNTKYDIRVKIEDPTTPALDGQQLYNTTKTRQEFRPPTPLEILYVSPDGSGNLYSRSQPGSLPIALKIAQAGTKIQLLPGHYFVGNLKIPNDGTPSNPIQIVGDPNGTSVINGSYPSPLVWTKYGNKGVWKTKTPVINPNLVIADGERLYPHQTYRDLVDDKITINSITNLSQPSELSGFYRNPTGAPFSFPHITNIGDPPDIDNQTLYIKFLDNSNPNHKEIYVTKQKIGLTLNNNDNIYIKGITFKYYGLDNIATALIINNSNYITIDSCIFDGNNTSIRLNHDSKYITISNTQFVDYFVNWHAWKIKTTQDLNNGLYALIFPKQSRYLEKGGVMVGNDFYGRGIVIKNNTFLRFHQAGHIAPKMSAIPKILDTLKRSFEIDFYNNELRRITGDFELDGHSRNIRIFNNLISHMHTFSVAPAQDGPTYFIRNVFEDIITDKFFNYSSLTLQTAFGQPLKFQYGSSSTKSRNGDIFFFHNTINTGNEAFGMNYYQVTIRHAFKKVVAKNNIFVNNQNVNFRVRTLNTPHLESDYNVYFSRNSAIASVDTNNSGGQSYEHLTELYSNYTWEEHSLQANPLFVHARSGNYRLVKESPGIDAGTIIPGINEMGFFGPKPDLGAFEWDGTANVKIKSKSLDVEIFPNPIKSGSSLTLKTNSNQKGIVIITDIHGHRIYEQEILGETTRYDLKHLSAGIYWMTIITNDKTTAKKIIII